MPKARKCKKQRVLSGSMTLTEVEEWFETRLLKERRLIAKKPKLMTPPETPMKKGLTHA